MPRPIRTKRFRCSKHDTAGRTNSSRHSIKVAEFIDVNDEMIDDGEVQVGMFGGSMIRGMTSELGHGELNDPHRSQRRILQRQGI